MSLPTVSSSRGTFLEVPVGTCRPRSVTGPLSRGPDDLQGRLGKVVFVSGACYLVIAHRAAVREEERMGPSQH